MEIGEDAVRVTCINPWYVKAPLQNIDIDGDVAMSEKPFLPRFGKPKDTGDATVFLAGDKASFITGANLAIDGAGSNIAGCNP